MSFETKKRLTHWEINCFNATSLLTRYNNMLSIRLPMRSFFCVFVVSPLRIPFTIYTSSLRFSYIKYTVIVFVLPLWVIPSLSNYYNSDCQSVLITLGLYYMYIIVVASDWVKLTFQMTLTPEQGTIEVLEGSYYLWIAFY